MAPDTSKFDLHAPVAPSSGDFELPVDYSAVPSAGDDLTAPRVSEAKEHHLPGLVEGGTLGPDAVLDVDITKDATNSTPIYITFQNVEYSAPLPHGKRARTVFPAGVPGAGGGPFGGAAAVSEKKILHGISGGVKPGELLAMMGPSGSGKTTFLNVLGGRAKKDCINGTIRYNGLPFSKTLKRKVGFVTQDDIFFANLTVRETLMYAALLRLPKSLTRQQKLQKADDIIVQLGLEKCRDTVIGGHHVRGVSGGERKRVSVGHEILIDPSVLLLDEPTSGLDSTTALKLVQLLISLAQAGRTVITTIHQPSSRMFHMFDKVLLLADGHPVYFGAAAQAMPHFAALGFEPSFASNPADFVLDIANGMVKDIRVPEDLPSTEPGDVKQYLVTGYRERLQPRLESSSDVHAVFTDEEKAATVERVPRSTNWFEQFSILWMRGLKERGTEHFTWLKFWQVVIPAVFSGFFWWRSKTDTTQQLKNQTGMLFFYAEFWGLFPVFGAIFKFPTERAMLAKERSSDMYSLSAYFVSRSLADIPMELVLPILFVSISYFMANLKATAEAFISTILTLLLTVVVAQGMGLAVGAAVMDVEAGTVMASAIFMIGLLAGGYYQQNIPKFVSWIKYLSYSYYSFRLLLDIQYNKSEQLNCGTETNVQMCRIKDSPALTNLPLGSGLMEAGILIGMLFLYRFVSYLFLRFGVTKAQPH